MKKTETVTFYYNKTSNKVMYFVDETVSSSVFSFSKADYLMSKPRNLGDMGEIVLGRRAFLKGVMRLDKELSNRYYIASIHNYIYWGRHLAYCQMLRRLSLTMGHCTYDQIDFLNKAI